MTPRRHWIREDKSRLAGEQQVLVAEALWCCAVCVAWLLNAAHLIDLETMPTKSLRCLVEIDVRAVSSALESA